MNRAYKNFIESLDTIKLEEEMGRLTDIANDVTLLEGMRYRAHLKYSACRLLLAWKLHNIEIYKNRYNKLWNRYQPLG